MPLRDSQGNIIGMIGNSLEITELKEAQKKLEEEKDRVEIISNAKSEFIANMSHDIRTPLSGIIAMTESIVKSAANIENRKKAYDAYLASKQLELLLNEILAASRFDMQQAASDEKEPVNLENLIQSVVDLFHPAAQQKDIKITAHYDSALPKTLMTMRVVMHRMLLNLVGNAIKFTNSGAIQINSKKIKSLNGKEQFYLSVKDTGIGMSQDSLEEIFEPFRRLTSAYQGSYKGSGLGLYIVKQIVDSLGGSIHVESQVGQGSEFICRFEMTVAEENSVAKDMQNLITNEFDTGLLTDKRDSQKFQSLLNEKIPDGVHVLLVEDDQLSQKIGQMNLMELGCDVDVVGLGEEALELIEMEHYDLVFLDVGIPDLSGYTITKKIRLHEQKTGKPRVPVIALTAHIDEAGQQKAREAGIDQVCFKPMSIDLVCQVFERWLLATHCLGSEQRPRKTISRALPIVDFNTIATTADEIKTAKAALAVLLQQLPKRLADIEKQSNKNNVKKLKEEVHQLHGCACYCGVPRLVQACVDLQNSVSHHTEQLDPVAYLSLLREIDAVQKQAPDYL